ncbi:beta-ketoacyl synthase N-terminal-like domain-containing protein [Pelosinus baikalensis]|uniref:Beta-ketoacyl synthase N-terminal domain-containing protein n=1 Tax=Pelosinus baikalensis TaxID=2892015 RepID=A0ABS8HTK4_9FIRM|nr:beta-ketoacyl synthase N-terminal-like domain-containing protein [Pelosinus baikalensis]MCC5466504.1 hypothetical protein [Pelosinus baikalensis]
MKGLGITEILYLSHRGFDEKLFTHRDSRVMDRFTKISVHVARNLFASVRGQKISPQMVGVVIATNTGAYQSTVEFNSLLAKQGVAGVNPSKFPNVMLSTPLSRVVTELQVRGPSVPLYLGKYMEAAFQYSAVQILKGRCDGILMLYTNEDRGCLGLFIEREESARERGLKTRFLLPWRETI